MLIKKNQRVCRIQNNIQNQQKKLGSHPDDFWQGKKKFGKADGFLKQDDSWKVHQGSEEYNYFEVMFIRMTFGRQKKKLGKADGFWQGKKKNWQADGF